VRAFPPGAVTHINFSPHEIFCFLNFFSTLNFRIQIVRSRRKLHLKLHMQSLANTYNDNDHGKTQEDWQEARQEKAAASEASANGSESGARESSR
jgi:hypothetical protein